ncbi:hypothetical protein FRC19_006155 [Serendipita sp. 401]|nr:hypothetical protein FRC19_006155 [Serendipita sp. 401]KAG9054043.1 hypothetical protein FS842_006358 [Serendipita sp. 407]
MRISIFGSLFLLGASLVRAAGQAPPGDSHHGDPWLYRGGDEHHAVEEITHDDFPTNSRGVHEAGSSGLSTWEYAHKVHSDKPLYRIRKSVAEAAGFKVTNDGTPEHEFGHHSIGLHQDHDPAKHGLLRNLLNKLPWEKVEHASTSAMRKFRKHERQRHDEDLTAITGSTDHITPHSPDSSRSPSPEPGAHTDETHHPKHTHRRRSEPMNRVHMVYLALRKVKRDSTNWRSTSG